MAQNFNRATRGCAIFFPLEILRESKVNEICAKEYKKRNQAQKIPAEREFDVDVRCWKLQHSQRQYSTEKIFCNFFGKNQ